MSVNPYHRILCTLLLLVGFNIVAEHKKASDSPGNLVIPEFALPMVTIPEATVSNLDFTQNLSLVNVYASWCKACAEERSILMAIATTSKTPLYGIDVKDKLSEVLRWLETHGDPYERSAFDEDGELMSALSIDALPQTLVINKRGEVVYRLSGPLTEEIWLQKLQPLFVDKD